MTIRNRYICWALVALLTGLAGLMMGGATLHAQDTPDTDDYVNRPPSLCGTCHEEVYANWLMSGHAQTINTEHFQTVWRRARENPDCMTCHSPAYDADTGEAAFAGVGCGACHMTVDPERRRADRYTYHGAMGTRRDPADCAGCHGADHAVTYIEWEASAHNGLRTVDCATCHRPHTGGLMYASGEALCGSCHLQEVPEVNPHMHVEGGCTDCHPAPVNTDNIHMHDSEAGVDCVTCHLTQEYDQYDRYLVWTGHTMEVRLPACLSCHGIHTPLESEGG